MRTMSRTVWMAFVAAALALPGAARADQRLAVFNFQMKSATPPWVWLEKGLSDAITTQLIRGGASVVARDEMQMMASELKWAPEMCQDPEIVKRLKEQMKIELLISGVYEIKGEKLEIVAQVVEVATRKEVCRRAVSGPPDAALELQQKLSAELLGWLQHKSAEQVLPALGPWTQSLPAARALYEGMHLFDEGRYGEAWLKFSKASADDPVYQDALYWSARMYYFMDRYDHARLAYDKFIYLDAGHPRLGDAIKEYLHTLEKTDTPPERLLAVYEDLIRRYPDVRIYNEINATGAVANKQFLGVRSGQLLGQLQRNAEAVRITAQDGSYLGQWGYRVAMDNAMSHHMLTGEVLMPPPLLNHYGRVYQFKPDNPQITAPGSGQQQYVWAFAIAPPGYVFKSLHFRPELQGEKHRLGVVAHKDSYGDVPGEASHTIGYLREHDGFLLDDLPRTGILHFHFYNDGESENWGIKETRIVAELEKIPAEHGAIRVACDNTADFRVYVDGRFGRSGSGLIGLLPPGRHALKFMALKSDRYGKDLTPYAPAEVQVEVKAGQVVPCTAALPWKKDSPWTGWTPGRFASRDYPGYDLYVNYQWARPAVQMDSQAIRLVWSRMGDLWWTISTDGEHFSPPRRLDMPVSTGWSEERPELLRDESGRFLLTFLSDRNGQRTRRLYACWSRDMVNWSAPALVLDRAIQVYDVMQDNKGRFLCADATEKSVVVLASREGYHWEKLAELPLPDWGRDVRIVQHPDGAYELAAAHKGPRPETAEHEPSTCDYIVTARSRDGSEWSPLKPMTILESDRVMSMSLMRTKGRSVLAFFEHANRTMQNRLVVQAETEGGQPWVRNDKGLGGVVSFDGRMAWHPRWGYVIAFCTPPGTQFPEPAEGPFILRGDSLKGVFGPGWKE